MTVDGRPNVRACVTPVRDGLRVASQRGLGEGRSECRLMMRRGMRRDRGRAGRSRGGARGRALRGRALLVDDNAELGGQYYRQLPAGFRGPRGSGARERARGAAR